MGAVIVAAGSSSRMQGVDKLHVEVAGAPILAHTLRAFERCGAIDEVVVVVAAGGGDRAKRLIDDAGARSVAAVVEGGARRQDSVAAGLARLSSAAAYVVVHDGARPMVTPEMIERGLQAARRYGAAIAAVPVTDTLKEVTDDGRVDRTIDRSRLWAVQTPQIFRRDLLERAHREVTEDVTDDATMVERLGEAVHVFVGAQENLKLTTLPDLAIFEALLAVRAGRT